MRRRLAQERGFGLVEVLVAGFILVVGIGGGVYTFVTSQKGSVTAERNATATAVASQALEEVRAMPYTAVGSDLTSVTQPLSLDGQQILSSGVFTTRDGKSEGIVPGTLPALSDVTVTEGGRTATYKVHRFVSWRDEECPLVGRVNLKDLKDDVMNMKADLDTLADDTKTLDTLSTTLGLDATLKAQTGHIDKTIEQLHDDANAIVTAIGALPGQPDGMVDMSIDLCDIPPGTAMPDLSGVAAARTLLATTNTHMDKLNTEAQGLISRLLSSLLCLLPCPVSQDPYKDAMRQAYGTIMGTAPASPAAPSSTDVVDNEIERVLDDLTVEIKNLKDLSDLSLFPDTKQNTKRVTVGVVNPIDRDGTGPRKVIWMTTVLINPEDGLL